MPVRIRINNLGDIGPLLKSLLLLCCIIYIIIIFIKQFIIKSIKISYTPIIIL